MYKRAKGAPQQLQCVKWRI